jgi:hypothetical protein
MRTVQVGAPLDIQRRKITRIFVHKAFKEQNIKNDIALLKLDVCLLLYH